MPDLPAEVEQQLASMSATDWDVLVAKVRAPDTAEAFREAAGKWISGDRLDAICSAVHVSQYVDENGKINAAKLERDLRTLFDDIPPRGPAHENFGQYAAPPDMGGPGDAGRAEARRRFSGNTPPPLRGRGGYDEAQKRFQKTNSGA